MFQLVEYAPPKLVGWFRFSAGTHRILVILGNLIGTYADNWQHAIFLCS